MLTWPARFSAYVEKEGLPDPLIRGLISFYEHYRRALQSHLQWPQREEVFEKWLSLVAYHWKHPVSFPLFHAAIRTPFDYYTFGLEFLRPFIDFSRSHLLGLSSLHAIQQQIARGENVILLANHQIEADPQVISLLIEPIDSHLASQLICVAGHRVTHDPMAIPLSLGRHLLCIYSKKYINSPPEQKREKIAHNQRAVKKMSSLLNEGGICLYVAPSGGRDRPNDKGTCEVAPFDPQSIELFHLLGRQAQRPTHFYPLALLTHPLMPPPLTTRTELGEERLIHVAPVFLALGNELLWDQTLALSDKEKQRQMRASIAFQAVVQLYRQLEQLHRNQSA